jgi:hypothetical protein
MDLFEPGLQALRAEARLLWAALRDWRLFVLLGIFAALLVLAAQAPLRYTIAIGKEEGYGSDRPIVAGFHDPEQSEATHSDFRWTTERSLIRLPGVGQRSLQLRLRLLPVNQEVAQRGPHEIEVWASGRMIGRLPIRPATGGTYSVLLPPPANGSGDQEIELRGTTVTPTGDQRAIGTPVDIAVVESAGGPLVPAWRSLLAWLAAALLFWLAVRRAGLAPNVALVALLAGTLLASLAALLDPPRFAFGANIALVTLALGWLLIWLLNAAPAGLLLAGAALALPAVVLRAQVGASGYEGWGGPGAVALALAAALLLAGWLRPALGTLYRRVAPSLHPGVRRWLALMALAIFASHYGGKIYPDSMWGDIGFHSNRYIEVLQGVVLLLSRNRGVDFPYPPALYLLLAPFGLLGLDKRVLLQLGGALLDAASPLLVYTIVVCGLGRAGCGPASRGRRSAALLAAGIYSFSAATLMTTWWNFSTHIFSQFAHLLLITVLVLIWRGPTTDDRRPMTGNQRLVVGVRSSIVWLFVLQSLVYLGHFGFWINTSLLGAMALSALLVATVGARTSRAPFWRLLAVFVAAELFATLFYYSAYTGLFIAQAQATAAGGLTGLANRGPADPALLWNNLWDAGFRTHFGFFPVPLALCGLLLIWQEAKSQEPRTKTRVSSIQRLALDSRFSVLIVLMVGTFLIALFFGSLPFITGSTLSTRWLMFSAWAIAVGAAIAAQLLWRSGRAGRWLVIAMGGYVLWITASMWLGALAWRIRPPEPF